jgi:large subunit ribosomal protein L29
MRELKAEKIRDMTEDEIEARIRELHEELFNLRFRNAMRQLQNPVLIRERRRDIARMRTILVEHRKGVRKLSGHGDAPRVGATAVAGELAKAAKAVKEPKRETTERKRAPKEAKKAAKEPKK